MGVGRSAGAARAPADYRKKPRRAATRAARAPQGALLLVVLLASALGGCSRDPAAATSTTAVPTASATSTTAAPSAGTTSTTAAPSAGAATSPSAAPTAAATGGTVQRLEPSPDRLERTLVGNDSRLVLRDASQPLALAVPPSARLEFAFGVADKGWRGVAEAKLQVAFADAVDGERRVLLERTLPSPVHAANLWSEIVLPLDDLAGRRGSLTLDARAPSGAAVGAWTNPALVVPATPPAPRTNLVLLSIDTLRADHLGAYGYARATSPAIDAMAARGVRFTSATAASSWTLPSHASMLTGLDPPRHGAVEFGFATPIPPGVTTVAEQLWSAGYDTAAFTDGFFVSGALGFDQGFDRFRGPTQLEAAARENLDLALAWMRARDGRPFFAFVHTYEAHMPYAPPPPYDTLFDPGYDGPYRQKFTFDDYEALEKAGGALAPRVVEHLKALYDGEIRHVDDAVGAFLDGLAQSGLAQSTCVVLTADHGEEFAEHGDLLHAHAKLYQELLHVPLIVWCPGRFATPRVVDGLVGLVDVAPTLLDLAGAPPFATSDGRSLRAALEGRPLPDDRAVLSTVDGSVEKRSGATDALRAGPFKLLRSNVHQPTSALYDLARDPGETVDVQGGTPDTSRALVTALDRALQQPAVAAPAAAPAERPQEATEERLRALGYVLGD